MLLTNLPAIIFKLIYISNYVNAYVYKVSRTDRVRNEEVLMRAGIEWELRVEQIREY